MRNYRLVEPYAGLAGLTCRVLFSVDSPVSRVGNKSKYAWDLSRLLIPTDGRVTSALLVDNDPAIVNFWTYLPELPKVLPPRLEGPPRIVWERARKERNDPGAEGAAAWLTWTAGARGGIGGFKGEHKLRPSVDGFIPARPSLIRRIVALAGRWRDVEVRLGLAEDVVFGPDDIAYLDPPYPGKQGYDGDTNTPAIALTWSNARAARRRAISADGRQSYGRSIFGFDAQWTKLERRGQTRRSLTRTADELLLLG